jgi:hypothetical protein
MLVGADTPFGFAQGKPVRPAVKPMATPTESSVQRVRIPAAPAV